MNINATLIGQMITFALFVWFTMKFVWPNLEKTLKERQHKIAEGLQAAERGHKELEIAQKYAIQHIHEARSKAVEAIEQAKKQAAFIIEQARQEANLEREQILTLGQAEVKQQQRVAREELKNEVASLVVLSAEKLLSRTITETDKKAFLDKGIDLQPQGKG